MTSFWCDVTWDKETVKEGEERTTFQSINSVINNPKCIRQGSKRLVDVITVTNIYIQYRSIDISLIIYMSDFIVHVAFALLFLPLLCTVVWSLSHASKIIFIKYEKIFFLYLFLLL